MTIQSVTQNQPAAPTAAPTNPSTEMGQETFLKLLVAELKHQDPMDPMQGRDMVAQLAQLSSVEKLSGIDSKLSSLQTSNAANTGVQSAGLIGRIATGDTRRLTLTDTTNPQGTYNLQAAAASVTVQVRDEGGNVVQTINGGAQRAGQQQFLWDGKISGGTRAPNGSYTFDVTATDTKNVSIPATTAVTGIVTEVTYENGAPQVVVAGAKIPLGDVTSIAQ